MANPASREQLKQYALRILGKPVIEINVDDDQLEDRLDEALQYFAQYHYDGVERTYLKYKVTQADVDRQTTDTEAQTSSKTASKVTNTFTGDGTTSVFTLGTAADNAAALTVKLDGVANTAFTVSGTTLTMTEGAVPNGVAIEVTIQNTVSTPWQEQPNYIICPEPVLAVNRIFPLSNRGNQNLFDIRYQLRLNDLYDFSSTSIIHYDMVLRHLDFLDDILVGEKPTRFNQYNNRLYIDMYWKNDISVGEYLIIECYRKLDPDTMTDVYNDIFLKRYVTALFKRQWGANLSKFNGVTMLGGVTLNGQQIFQEAQEDIRKLEEEIRGTYETPVTYMIG